MERTAAPRAALDGGTRLTDSIPRASIQQVLSTLAVVARGAGTFESVRRHLLTSSERRAPASAEALWTVARDALSDLQRLGLIERGPLPRKRADVAALGGAPCEATTAGRDLGALYTSSPGDAYDRLLLIWLDAHPYFRSFQQRLASGPLHVPTITSVRDLRAERADVALIEQLPTRLAEACGARLRQSGASSAAEVERLVTERSITLARQHDLPGMDAKRLLDAIDDSVVIPAVLAAESLPGDPVTFQHLLKIGKEFLSAASSSSHPDYPGRVLYATCAFLPEAALRSSERVTGVLHHGRSWARGRFVASLASNWSQLPRRAGGYTDVYALRARVCLDLGIQPGVFDACLSSVAEDEPPFVIYTEVPFGPPPAGEDYAHFGKHRVGRIRLSFKEGV